jgi:Uma2 family endonuclease
MANAGVFSADARLELMEGEIIETAPIGSAHAAVVNALAALLNRQCEGSVIVSVQNPIVAGDRSVPQPDLALLKLRRDGYFHEHPTATDVLLMIEVADTTLQFDLERKAHVYASASIEEMWVIELEHYQIHIFCEPTSSGYRRCAIAQRTERVAPQLVAGISFELASVLPAT